MSVGGWAYETRRSARQKRRAAFAALREQVSPLVQQGDELSLERAKQVTDRYRRENAEKPEPPAFMRRIGEMARKGLEQRQSEAAAQPQKRAGVPRGVAEASPEEAEGRKVYDAPDPLGQKFAQTGAGGFLKEIGAMVLNAGRPGVGAVNAALQGDNPIGGAFREGGDVYDAEGKPLERYTALNNPGINRLPDKGLEIGPVNLTPKTVAGFAMEEAADWTNLVDLPIGQAVGGVAGKVLRRGGDDAAQAAAKPSFLQTLGQKVSPAPSGGAPMGPMLDPMHPSSATQRLFNIRQPQQVLSRTDRVMNAIKTTIGAGTPADEIATPIMRERQRVMRNVESQANRLGEIAGQVETAFQRDAKGRISNLPGQPTIQDLAAKLPMYQSYLTPEQNAAMQTLKREVLPYGDALRELGFEFGDRPDIIDGGFYIPRGNSMEEGADVPRKVGTGRGRGKAGHLKGVKFEESMTEGIDAGYEYAPFREAVQNYGRRAGQDAADQWTADAFKATGLGESAADRINPGLRAQVETLRAKIAQRRATLVRQRARRTPLNQAARDTERMAARAEEAAGRTGARMEAQAARAGQRGERIAQRADDMLGKAAGAQERAAQETVGLADKARERLRRLQWRIDEINRPLATAVEVEPIPAFQQIISDLPGRQASIAKATELRAQLTRDANGRILKNRKNKELVRQIAELDTIAELHDALERAGGDIGEAMDLFYERLNRYSHAMETRADPGARLVMTGNTGARLRAQTKRASKRRGYDAYVNAMAGTEGDFDILREQVTAMADVVEAADFEVFPDIDTPPNLGNAPTEEVMAAAQRELKVLEREAGKQTRRADRASAQAVRQGDALMTQAQRNTAQGAADAQRGAKAAQRGTNAQWRTATRAEQRAATRDAAEAATGAEYDQLRDDLRTIMGQWKKAKEQAAQTPRDQGSIGLAGLNGTTFPDALANVANDFLNNERGISGKGALPVKAVNALNSLLRGLRASVDVSFIGIQGLLGAVTHPREYRTALATALRAMSDERALGAYITNFDEAARVAKMPDSRAWAAVGLRIGGSDTEFAIGQGLGPKVGRAIRNAPLIKQSNRMFGFFGDTMRLEAADAMARAAKASKKPLTPDDLAEIAHAANLLTGTTDKSFGGATGELFLFAPRFFASQLELAGRALTLDPSPAGDEARTALIRLIGVGSLITVGINEARGKETDFNPTSSNFMRIRDLGGQDISLFGPWDSLVKGIAATGKGDYNYFARTKASPTVALVWDLAFDKTFTGEKARTPEYFMRSLLPFSISDIGRESPMNTLVNTTGVKSSDLSPREQLDREAKKTYKRGWGDLTLEERGELTAAHPDLAQKLSDARQGKYGEYEDAKKRTGAQLTSLNDQLLNGTLTREQWRDGVNEANLRLQGARDQIFGDEQEPPSAEEQERDPAMKYLAIRMEFRDKKTGLVDEAAFDAALRERMTASQIEAAYRGFGADDLPLQKLRSKVAREYYAIPRYQGLSAEDGQAIDRAWDQVLAIAGNTDNRLKKLQAIRKVGVTDPQVKRALYRRVYGHGLTLDKRRERWAARHPEARPLLGLGRGIVTDEERNALEKALGQP